MCLQQLSAKQLLIWGPLGPFVIRILIIADVEEMWLLMRMKAVAIGQAALPASFATAYVVR